MEEKVAEQTSLMEVDKNCKEGNDFYKQMVESMLDYFEKLNDLYDQTMIMRLESAKTKLDYLKCQQDLENINSFLESNCEESEDIKK